MSERWSCKYRPNQFNQVLGQEHIKQFFEIVLANFYEKQVSLPVGALFCGHSGVGKTTLARIVAASLNCQYRLGIEPCGKCSSCKAIVGGTGGVFEVDATFFGDVENIKSLRKRLYLHSLEEYQIVILDECHMLSKAASNVLLKLLEEPPEKVFFILITTEAEALVETVRSRLLEFKFKTIGWKISLNYIKKLLEREHLSCADDLLYRLYLFSNQNLRDLIVSLEQISFYNKKVITKEILETVFGDIFIFEKILDCLLKGDFNGAVELYEKFSVFQNDFRIFLEGFCEILGRRFQKALIEGRSESGKYAKILSCVYSFLGKRLNFSGSASSSLLFFKIIKDLCGDVFELSVEDVQKPLLKSKDVFEILLNSKG